jgi:hypothetical protein
MSSLDINYYYFPTSKPQTPFSIAQMPKKENLKDNMPLVPVNVAKNLQLRH